MTNTNKSYVKDSNGNNTGGYVFKSIEGQILSQIMNEIQKFKIDYALGKQAEKIGPKNNTNTPDNSNDMANRAIRARINGEKYPGIKFNFDIFSDLSNTPL